MANSKYLIVDGVEYKVPIIELKRSADILDLEANRDEDGVLHREVIGTYYNYTLNIGVINDPVLYETLWNVFSAPVASHMVELPHDHVRYEAYISSVSDNITLLTKTGYKAKGLAAKFTAVRPARTPS